MPIYLTILTL